MKPRNTASRRYILLALKIALTATIFYWLVSSGRINLSGIFTWHDLPWHGLALVVVFTGVVAQGLRWWLLLRLQEIDISPRQAIEISLIGAFGSLIIPGSAGIEVIRTYYIAKHAPGRRLAGFASVLADRLLGLYALFVLCAAALVWLAVHDPTYRVDALRLLAFVSVPLVVMPLGLALNTHPRARAAVLRLAPRRWRLALDASVAAFRLREGSLLAGLALSFVNAFSITTAYFLAGQIASSTASFVTVCTVSPIVTLMSVIPLTPSGIGVTEASAAVLFNHFGVGGGATLAILIRCWMVITAIPGGVLYMVGGAIGPRERDAKVPEGVAHAHDAF